MLRQDFEKKDYTCMGKLRIMEEYGIKIGFHKEPNFYSRFEQIAVQGLAYTVVCDISLLTGHPPLFSVLALTINSLFRTAICRGGNNVICMLAMPIQAIRVDSEQHIGVFLVPSGMADRCRAIVRPFLFYWCTRNCVSILIGSAVVILLDQ